VKKKPPELVLTMAAESAVRHGHPWVWDKGVARKPPSLPAGAEVALVSGKGEALGVGVYEPGSPIAVRVWSTEAVWDERDGVAGRLRRAFGLRQRLFSDGSTTAYRLLHGEGDRAPGIVIDRYDHIGVVRLDGAGAEAFADRHREVIVTELSLAGVTDVSVRRSKKGAPPAFDVWANKPLPETITVKEHGVPFVVDLRAGQKTGAFLDQRDNRRRVGELAGGRRVLNLFSYAGGFSLHAALGGATHVTSVDIAAAAHGTAQASFRAAGVDPKAHDFVSADVFAFLSGAKSRGQTWDLVISDPPSFAPSEKSLPRALAAYRSLHEAASNVLASGGVFCAASCSSHVTAEAFVSTLDDAAVAKPLSLLALHGPPPDHPTVAGWPEGRYLKFAVMG
jgi:23S rRNA (cytosine1962-C5)-methyltransferase